MPVGRPSKYDPKFCDMLIEHMAEGYSFETFAAKIDVNQDTLHEWAKVHKDFSESKKIAFAKCQIFWERLGINHILNSSEKDEMGNSRSVSLNTGAWIFNMKNRFKWTDRVEVQGSGDDTKPLILAYKK